MEGLKATLVMAPDFMGKTLRELTALVEAVDCSVEARLRFRDLVFDLFEKTLAIDLKAAATGDTGDCFITAEPSKALRELMAAFRAGDFDNMGARHG